MLFNRSSTVISSPVSRKTCEPPMEEAFSLMRTSSFFFKFPLSNSSIINNKVIIFVILAGGSFSRSEEHTSELQSRFELVCRLLLEKKNRARLYHVKQ